MAGLAASISLAAKGEDVTLVESQAYPGGKMRQVHVGSVPIDAGPTVFTMKWVFEDLFHSSGSDLQSHVKLKKAETLARHAWDGSGHFDLFADIRQSEQSIRAFFDDENAAGFRRFNKDAKAIYETLERSFIAASRPNPFQLAQRVGLTRIKTLLGLRPFSTLWKALGDYFPDPRLRQLYGRYATYVGSSPYLAPATLMLIAHVEQEGVWYVEGGMHALAVAMRDHAESLGVTFASGSVISRVETDRGRASGVVLENGERLPATNILYCGDISHLGNPFFIDANHGIPVVKPKDRALSAITFNMVSQTSGLSLHRHNVFFSDDYAAEFNAIFNNRNVPQKPTIYVCAQNRDDDANLISGGKDHLLCLINAPAFGDTRRLDEQELSQCEEITRSHLEHCGLRLGRQDGETKITQPADFEVLFPGSGGALYGRASHGWTASFSRPGSKTKIPGLYLAGGSVHPGAGVPMATLSGMLAAQQMIEDRHST